MNRQVPCDGARRILASNNNNNADRYINGGGAASKSSPTTAYWGGPCSVTRLRHESETATTAPTPARYGGGADSAQRCSLLS
jgi:hypothetical protein